MGEERAAVSRGRNAPLRSYFSVSLALQLGFFSFLSIHRAPLLQNQFLPGNPEDFLKESGRCMKEKCFTPLEMGNWACFVLFCFKCFPTEL